MSQPTAESELIPQAILDRYRRATTPSQRMEVLDEITWDQIRSTLWAMDGSGGVLGVASVPPVVLRADRGSGQSG